MRHGYTIAEQSRAVFVLRRDIRKAHVDVRFNSRVAADCWRIIDAIENGEVALEPHPSSATGTTTATSTPTRANGKRKSLDSQPQPRPARSAAARGKKRKVE